MGTHHLSKLICGMRSWKRYRQMTLSFDDSNGSPGNGWSKFFLNFSPTTQHDQKGNHGYYFSASTGCLSNRVTDSEAQASHFTPFCPLGHLHFSQSSVISSNNALQFHYPWTQWLWGSTKALGKIMKKGQFFITCPMTLPLPRSPMHTLQYT